MSSLAWAVCHRQAASKSCAKHWSSASLDYMTSFNPNVSLTVSFAWNNMFIRSRMCWKLVKNPTRMRRPFVLMIVHTRSAVRRLFRFIVTKRLLCVLIATHLLCPRVKAASAALVSYPRLACKPMALLSWSFNNNKSIAALFLFPYKLVLQSKWSNVIEQIATCTIICQKTSP